MISKPLLRKALIVAIAFQLVVLMFMAGKRESIIANGESVYLRTAPIDPRDPFRGDFVRLQYNINRVHKTEYQGETHFDDLNRGDLVYAVLDTLDGEVYFAAHYTDTPPDTRPFIKGRVEIQRWHASVDRTFIQVKFGIEQFFVQQGKGKDMEKQLGSRDGLQIPAEMEVALGKDGTAVIRDFRWSKLGIQLIVTRESGRDLQTEDGSRPLSPKLDVIFNNVSEEPYDLVFLPEDCSFSLMETDRTSSREKIDAGCDESKVGSVISKTLKPGESHTFNIDMEQPRWRVLNEKQNLVYVSERNLRQMYRLRFHAPDKERAWQGYIDTPRFNPEGRID